MKKIFLISSLIAASLVGQKIDMRLPQSHTIKILATNPNAEETVASILDTFSLAHEKTQDINLNDKCLYILAGKNLKFDYAQLPEHFIVYQTEKTSELDLELLKRATVVWDASWDNINEYKKTVPHYYYLPNENYDYLDPVILACFLPFKALDTYKQMVQYSNNLDTDISSHVPSLFVHTYHLNPDIIVEAGVRGGEGSTIPMRAASNFFNTLLIGLDVEDDAHVYTAHENSMFIKIDDRRFAEHFKTMNLAKKTIDYVFIDTSHEYHHTMKEIEVFTSILSDFGAMGFHDSNVTPLQNGTIYTRINGTISPRVYGNPRGVTRALKTYFNMPFDEHKYLNRTIEKYGYEWHIIHYPFCNGFTFAKRIRKTNR